LKKRAIRKLIAEGELPARLIGRQWLVVGGGFENVS
jgi:hypothetical protein